METSFWLGSAGHEIFVLSMCRLPFSFAYSLSLPFPLSTEELKFGRNIISAACHSQLRTTWCGARTMRLVMRCDFQPVNACSIPPKSDYSSLEEDTFIDSYFFLLGHRERKTAMNGRKNVFAFHFVTILSSKANNEGAFLAHLTMQTVSVHHCYLCGNFTAS